MPKIYDAKNMDSSPLDLWWAFLTMSADQNSNVAAGDHIEFDTIQKSGTFDVYQDDLSTEGDWDTDTGQDLGIIELKAGKTYKLMGAARLTYTADGYGEIYFYDRTNSTEKGIRGINYTLNSSTASTSNIVAIAVITPSTDIKVEIRFSPNMNDVSSADHNRTWALIEQIRDED